ncbi:MAG: protein-methionine-sulfoxide reductase catalytic subunit MsrP [Alphaproteobacteria bacterium]
MLIRNAGGWELPESAATPESVYARRRTLVKALAVGPILAAVSPLLAACDESASDHVAEKTGSDLPKGPYPVPRNGRYGVDRAVSAEDDATKFNNYYEFGSQKSIWRQAQALALSPWMVTLDGLVEKPISLDFDQLLKQMPLEERVYRHRCVEAWAMTVPWSGFPMKALVDLARPLAAAKYVRMETFHNPKVATGQGQSWYPWPYIEGLTMAEATNELAFIATGLYGKTIPKQNGAPLRLVTPWKYGFKSIKSIVRFEFTDKRPVSFWEEVQPHEYGFWANVNPDVPHPRWSQASEELLGTNERVPTRIFNGYGEFVADLYKGLERERLWA